MLRIRTVLLSLSLSVGLGSLSASIAYAWYINSSGYVRRIEQRVSTYLGLPVTIDAFEPTTLDALQLTGVQAFLPERHTSVFRCTQATWRRSSQDHLPANTLELTGGRLAIGSPEWAGSDYRRVLESGFAHDFADLGLERVYLWNMDIHAQRPSWTLDIADADGLVDFASQDQKARAQLQTHGINGHHVEQPIRCTATFTPAKLLVMHQVELEVPRMPIAHLQLDELLNAQVTEGLFTGKITYSEDAGQHVSLSGMVEGLDLSVLSGRLAHGPLAGRLDRVQIEQAQFSAGELESIAFSGRLTDLQLGDFAGLLDRPGVRGAMQLEVSHGLLLGQRIAELKAEGTIRDIDLEELTTALELGRITGRLDVQIKRIEVLDDQLTAVEIEAEARPPEDQPGTVDRELIAQVVERFFGTPLPDLPFEELEYVHLGLRLVIKGQQLRLYGLYGDGQRTICSLDLFGQELPVIRAPDRDYELGDLIAIAREKAADYDFKQLLRQPQPDPHQPE